MRSKNPKKNNRINTLEKFAILTGIVALIFTILLICKIYNSGNRLISLSIVPLLGGLIYEYRLISDSWKKVILTFFGAYILSFLVFFQGKHEYIYILDNHIKMWPYAFCIIFIIIAIIIYDKKLIPKLGEGFTMLQSIAFVYWIIDRGFLLSNNYFIKSLIIIGLIFSSFSLFHAFTYSELTKNNRFALSLWSSIIMMVFAIDNSWRVFNYNNIDFNDSWILITFNTIQYFLLGISSIFIVRNFYMVIGFLPGRGTFFNEQYFKDIKDLRLSHIDRYSSSQVKIKHSLIAFLFSVLLFGLNHYLDLVPSNFLIWIVFVTFPLVFMIYKLTIKSTTTNTRS